MRIISDIIRIVISLPKELRYQINLDRCPYDRELKHDYVNCTLQFSLPICSYKPLITSALNQVEWRQLEGILIKEKKN